MVLNYLIILGQVVDQGSTDVEQSAAGYISKGDIENHCAMFIDKLKCLLHLLYKDLFWSSHFFNFIQLYLLL